MREKEYIADKRNEEERLKAQIEVIKINELCNRAVGCMRGKMDDGGRAENRDIK